MKINVAISNNDCSHINMQKQMHLISENATLCTFVFDRFELISHVEGQPVLISLDRYKRITIPINTTLAKI